MVQGLKSFIYTYTLLFVVFCWASFVGDELGHYLPKVGRDRISFNIRFNERLVHHGLNFDVNAIYTERGIMYFTRNGKRCVFSAEHFGYQELITFF